MGPLFHFRTTRVERVRLELAPGGLELSRIGLGPESARVDLSPARAFSRLPQIRVVLIPTPVPCS